MNILTSFVVFSIIMLVLLSFNVIRERQANHIALGDSGVDSLSRAIRVQANFLEYTPLFLLGVFLLFYTAQPINELCFLCLTAAFGLGRIMHAFALLYHEPKIKAVSPLRKIGMLLTFLSFIVLAIALLTALH